MSLAVMGEYLCTPLSLSGHSKTAEPRVLSTAFVHFMAFNDLALQSSSLQTSLVVISILLSHWPQCSLATYQFQGGALTSSARYLELSLASS